MATVDVLGMCIFASPTAILYIYENEYVMVLLLGRLVYSYRRGL